MDETRIPILVGSGQVTQREPDPTMAFSNGLDCRIGTKGS